MKTKNKGKELLEMISLGRTEVCVCLFLEGHVNTILTDYNVLGHH